MCGFIFSSSSPPLVLLWHLFCSWFQGLLMNSRSTPLFVPLVLSTSSVDTLWVYSWFGLFLWWGLLWLKWSYLWSSIRTSQFSVCIYTFNKQVCRVWRWIFKTKIRVCNQSKRVFQFVIFLSVALSPSGYMFTWGLSPSIWNSVSMLFIYSAFLLWYFRSYILLQIFLPLSHLVVNMASPNIPLIVDRMFLSCFGTSCFVYILCSCLGIFLVLFR